MAEYFFPTDGHVEEFRERGFIRVPKLLCQQEIELLNKIARSDSAIMSKATGRLDAAGGTTKLALENHLQQDAYSAVVRAERVAGSMARLLGEEVYHYHHKVMLKEPLVGGAWEWHQDYGYWYDYGCLKPDMASCFIAIDPCTRENGCLKVVSGSHQFGRINHMRVGEQTGADPERVEAILERLPLEYVEMEPGDGLFFHGNLLHASDRNASEQSRWTFISCFNTRSNSPYKPSRHPDYSPLDILPDEELIQLAQQHWRELIGSS